MSNDTTPQERAAGSRRRFHHTETARAPRSAVWALWSNPSRWGEWDKGLEAAVIDGSFKAGATGTITPLKGPKAAFIVEAVEAETSYTFATKLPGAKLRVRREFIDGGGSDGVAFRHTVWFDGPMAWLFSRLYGNQFRTALPPTMRELARLAEASR